MTLPEDAENAVAPDSTNETGAAESTRTTNVQENVTAQPPPPSRDPVESAAPQERANVKPPASQPSDKSLRQKKEINPDFRDVNETGKWGHISRCETYVVATVVLMVVVGVIVTVVVLVTGGDKNNDSAPAPATMRPTSAPSAFPTITASAELSAALSIIRSNPLTNGSAAVLPNNLTFYKNKSSDESQPYEVRAMSWLLYVDTRNRMEEVQFRYALASLYYALGGDSWVNSTNWLTSTGACQWFGVRCDPILSKLHDLDLETNNLVGTIPPEISLLNQLVSLLLPNNALNGTLPGTALAAIPTLGILSVSNNKFVGTIPSNLQDNGVFNSLFVQENNFTGAFPYCDKKEGFPLLDQFGVDCDAVMCACCSFNNCF